MLTRTIVRPSSYNVVAHGQAGGMTDTKAVLLVGGQGTRLRSLVPSAPKPLAPVGDRPFLELLIRQLQGQGIRQLVMCSGYLADQIEAEFGDGQDLGVAIEYSRETQPLGQRALSNSLNPPSKRVGIPGDEWGFLLRD